MTISAFDETTDELCAEPVLVWIGAMQGGDELARKSIRVHPVHDWWTLPAHIHGPGEQQHLRDNADFTNDYNFLRFKYAAVLATTQGGFNGPPTISTETCVPCPDYPGTLLDGPCAYACTTNGSVVFGTDTFTDSENQAASIIGHELLHTTGADECQAYRWEAEHCDGTRVCPCDGGEDEYLGSVLDYLLENTCP